MNAQGHVQCSDGLAALNSWREVLENEHLELEWAVRRCVVVFVLRDIQVLRRRSVLRPAGFGHDPAQWQGLAHSVMTFLNCEYRHEAKIDIQEGA